ncbi:hypothetical protein RQP46_003818 [Phenoliferia psychrophenolica]
MSSFTTPTMAEKAPVGAIFPPSPDASTPILSDSERSHNDDDSDDEALWTTAGSAEQQRPRWLRAESTVGRVLNAPQATRIATFILAVGVFLLVWPHAAGVWTSTAVVAPNGEADAAAAVVAPDVGSSQKQEVAITPVEMDRILVLPNVGHSQVGACLPHEFEFYYAHDALSTFGIPTVTQKQFSAWLNNKSVSATGQMIILEKTKDINPSLELGGELQTSKWTDKHPCVVADFKIDYSSQKPAAFRGPFDKNTKMSNWLVNSIVSHVRYMSSSVDLEDHKDPDVVTIGQIVPFWKLSTGGIDLSVIKALKPDVVLPPRPFDHLAYAPGWADLTATIASNLQPFVAVHWRTEQLDPKNLEPCATALMAKLSELKLKNPSLTSVFIATDYPLESIWDKNADASPHSGSYRIPKEAHRAFRRLYEWFQSGESGLRQTSWSREEQEMKIPASTRELLPEGLLLRDVDLSLLGMIDKAVLMQADYFLAGSQGQCGKRSSWTASVANARKETIKGIGEFASSGRELLNEVEYWGL